MRSMLVGALLATTLTGCVLTPQPVDYAPTVGVVVPAGVAYVPPAYPMPGPGYLWSFNVAYGWGWRHPVYGWYRPPGFVGPPRVVHVAPGYGRPRPRYTGAWQPRYGRYGRYGWGSHRPVYGQHRHWQ
jgi:hypothetical protein